MKTRLIQACVVALIAAAVGVGISIQVKSDQMPGIVIASAVVGFFFGLVFKIRPV